MDVVAFNSGQMRCKTMLSFHSKTGEQEWHAVLTITILFTAIIIPGCSGGELNYSVVFHVFLVQPIVLSLSREKTSKTNIDCYWIVKSTFVFFGNYVKAPFHFFLLADGFLASRILPLQQAIKIAEHSFQVPMPNLPLLWNYLWFGALFLQELRLTTGDFILRFL